MKYWLLILTFLLVSCTKNKDRSDQINISLTGEVTTLDPANCFDTVCYMPLAQVYESLYEIEYLKRPYTLRPLLAEGFPTVSRDRKKYTSKSRKGSSITIQTFFRKAVK